MKSIDHNCSYTGFGANLAACRDFPGVLASSKIKLYLGIDRQPGRFN